MKNKLNNSHRSLYPTDLTERQWQILRPWFEPELKDSNLGGRPAKYPVREILNAVLYHTRGGQAWRLLPHDLPPWQSVYGYFRKWGRSGLLERVNDELCLKVRTSEDRKEQPTAAIIDAQSVKGAQTVGFKSRGYDAGKKINGRKRHLAVDTIGLLLCVIVSAASVQDRDGAKPLLENLRDKFPTISLVWADGGYTGKLLIWAQAQLMLVVAIAKRTELHSFEVVPRRWVVERTFAWIMLCRRNCRDYERLPEVSEAFVTLTMIGLMTRRLARQAAYRKKDWRMVT